VHPRILTVDCGTQSIRVGVIDARGNRVGFEKVSYEPYFSKAPGWAEQDPEIYWNAFCTAARRLKENQPDALENLSGLVVSTLRDTAVAMDEEGRVLRPSIIWLDQRKSTRKIRFSVKDRAIFFLIGMQKTVNTICANAKSNWMIDHEREIWDRAYRYVTISGYFYFRLTGQWTDSIAAQIGHFPFDYRKHSWDGPSSWKWLGFGIERSKLPQLVEPGAVIGELTPRAAQACGLPKGLPVIAGASDKGCETVGCGCVAPHAASISLGTTATIQITIDRYIEPIRFMPPYPAAVKGAYNPEVEIFRGYWMVTWFKREFGVSEVIRAQELGITPEELLNQRLSEVPPGCHGLLLQPYWSPHVKTPIAKGAMIGFGEVHTRMHIYRAIVEGINYGLIDGMEKIERQSKTPITEIHVSGGGAQSEPICQITADMFDREVFQPAEHETSTLGAAMIGFVGLKIHKDFAQAIREMSRYRRVYHPNPENARIYRDLYNKAYRNIYPRLKHIYRDIKETIHYPPD